MRTSRNLEHKSIRNLFLRISRSRTHFRFNNSYSDYFHQTEFADSLNFLDFNVLNINRKGSAMARKYWKILVRESKGLPLDGFKQGPLGLHIITIFSEILYWMKRDFLSRVQFNIEFICDSIPNPLSNLFSNRIRNETHKSLANGSFLSKIRHRVKNLKSNSFSSDFRHQTTHIRIKFEIELIFEWVFNVDLFQILFNIGFIFSLRI